MYQPKISLKNLHLASEQEVFDQVAVHLLEQGTLSMSRGGSICAYRGEHNRMCGAGCLMADDEYKPEFEKASWFTLVNEGVVPNEHMELIRKLQRIHDCGKTKTWKNQLLDLASQFELSTSAIDKL